MMSILAICTLRFWVPKYTSCSYEMEQARHVILLARKYGTLADYPGKHWHSAHGYELIP